VGASFVDIQTTIRIDRIAARLSAIIRERTELDVAQFQFVGLDYIAQELGPFWVYRRGRIWDVAESFILSQLQSNDILVRNDEGFLVIFATKISDAAHKAAQDIAFELNTRLAKHSDRLNPRVSTSSGPVRVHDLARMIRGRGETPPASAASEPPALTRVDWRFQPVWDAEREAISRHFLVPVVRDTEERVRGYQFEDLDKLQPDFAAIDEASLLVSEQALKRLRSEGKNAVIGVTLHINSLREEKSASRLMNALARLDLSLARDRMITVAGVKPGFPKLQLGHTIAALRMRVPQVALSAAWDEPDIGALIAAGPTAIGFAYPDKVAMALARLAGGTLMARFTAGADVAHAYGLPLYVEGAIDRLQAFAFREAGADYLASPLIWRPASAPDSELQWRASGLSAAR
jgi:EAL domain-containing protein (putative c-di-GMP-specific phosphodiesterase class I)